MPWDSAARRSKGGVSLRTAEAVGLTGCTRAIQAYLGHKNIQQRSDRFKDFWDD